MERPTGALLPVLCLLATPGVALADDVLVYQTFAHDAEGGDAAAGEAQEVLEGLGHTVTVIAADAPVLPADLSVFDTIWVIQLLPIPQSDQNLLRAYVKAGGGLYLTGERDPCCNALNGSLDDLFNGLLIPPAPYFSFPMEGGALMLPSPANPFGLTTTPNVIVQWETLGAGAIGYPVPERVVFESPSGVDGAVAFVGEDMELAGGCVYVAMDLSFWLDVVAPKQDLAPLTENIETFLTDCDDVDHDGLSDSGESGFGTDPNDADTDDDSLCDGFGTVASVCESGESPFYNFDNDSLVNPLDDDDDGDTLPTRFEVGAEGIAPNVDADYIAAYYDLDSDADFILDNEEGSGDYDHDGIPAIVDQDDPPTECDSDADCGFDAGLYCNLEVGYCHPVPVEEPPDDTDGTDDTDDPATGPGDPDPDTDSAEAKNCGCLAAGPTGSASIGLVALWLVLARRRTR